MGCEVIKEEDRYLPMPVPYSARTHVMIEFTGFRCVNCPKASETAQDLKNVYGEQLVVVAMHPASNPFTQGLYDYTCPAADVYYQTCGGTAQTPFPTGSIDLQTENNSYFFDPSEWAARLNRVMQDTVCPYLRSEIADATTDTLTVITYASSATTKEGRIAIWLVEDSIQGVQAMPDGSVNTQYYHRHMLRTTGIDGAWGTTCQISPLVTRIEQQIVLPEDCRPAYCTIVTVLMDQNDNNILQAYETKLDDYRGTTLDSPND